MKNSFDASFGENLGSPSGLYTQALEQLDDMYDEPKKGGWTMSFNANNFQAGPPPEVPEHPPVRPAVAREPAPAAKARAPPRARRARQSPLARSAAHASDKPKHKNFLRRNAGDPLKAQGKTRYQLAQERKAKLAQGGKKQKPPKRKAPSHDAMAKWREKQSQLAKLKEKQLKERQQKKQERLHAKRQPAPAQPPPRAPSPQTRRSGSEKPLMPDNRESTLETMTPTPSPDGPRAPAEPELVSRSVLECEHPEEDADSKESEAITPSGEEFPPRTTAWEAHPERITHALPGNAPPPNRAPSGRRGSHDLRRGAQQLRRSHPAYSHHTSSIRLTDGTSRLRKRLARPKFPKPKELTRKDIEEQLQELEAQKRRLVAKEREATRARKQAEEDKRRYEAMIAEQGKSKEQREDEFDRYKRKETKAMERRRRELDRKEKELNRIPDRRQRDQIEELKAELEKVREECARKGKQQRANINRLNKERRQLAQKNEDLKKEVLRLEKARLEVWQPEPERPDRRKRNGVSTPRRKRPAPNFRRSTHNSSQTAASASRIRQNATEREPSPAISSDRDGYEPSDSVDVADPMDVMTTSPPMIVPEVIGERRTYDASKFAGPDTPAGLEPEIPEEPGTPEQLAGVKPEAGWDRVDALVQGVNKIHMDKPYPVVSRPSPSKGVPLVFQHDFLTEEQRAADVVRSRTQSTQMIRHTDGKTEYVYADGSRLLAFHNGTEKEMFGDGVSRILFANHDVKKVLANGEEIYYYASNDITHVTSPDGTQRYFFANKQNEVHHPDGTKEIMFGDGTKKYVYPSGDEQSIFPDGTIQRVVDGAKTMIPAVAGMERQ